MAKSNRFNESDLLNLGLVFSEEQNSYIKKKLDVLNKDLMIYGEAKIHISVPIENRRLSLKLFGEPMPKQSVRSFCTKKLGPNGNHILGHFQPKEMDVRVKDYQRQIREQLPKDFIRFDARVHVTKMHFIFPPLKSFSRKIMDSIEKGDIIYKETKPDLPDNLKKLVNDSMSDLVYRDDSIIVSEDNVKKYYGTGGLIIIELEGY